MTVTSMEKTQELLERHRQVLLPVQTKMLYYGDQPLAVDRARGSYLWDVEGRRYLDFFGGILTVSVGHCNEEVTAATVKQMETVGHTSMVYLNEITIRVAEKLAELTPGRLQYSFFTSSGTEANETALMAARTYTGNRDVIALRHAYSGRSASMMSMTAHSNWRMGGVYDGSIKHVRSPEMYRRPRSMSESEYLDFLVADFEDFLATSTDGRIAAFMAEPIQGVGGFQVVPRDYFKRIEPLVREAGGVMIIDEVQTGWGRTGDHLCAINHWELEPDIMTFAKGIANGAPVGATIMVPEIAESISALTLATYGGTPVSMAQAYATISYIEENRLWENAARKGALLRQRLEALQEKHAFIGDVRGMGLMQGLELVQPGTQVTDADRANALTDAAREQGLLIGKGGRYGNVMRIAPMLNISSTELEEGCDLLEKALDLIA
jgi:4-aminobutyrate aminotransferase-like enzyme